MYRKRESINNNFAQSPLFLKACELSGTKPTKRQASKFRSRKGLAYGFINRARCALKEDGRSQGTQSPERIA